MLYGMDVIEHAVMHGPIEVGVIHVAFGVMNAIGISEVRPFIFRYIVQLRMLLLIDQGN